jgi:hypothetical protein
MHPLIARFLDLPAAIATLEKAETDSTLDADESALIAAAIASPRSRDAVLKAKGKQKASAEAEQHLVILATRAATKRLAVDPKIGPRMTSARAALEKEGATAEEADGLIAQAVLEEAFGYAEDPGTFDADFLAETLDSLAHLGAITQDTIDTWLEEFAKAGDAQLRALRLAVAEAVLESAWSDGPQPITPEHLDEALEKLGDTVAESDFARATQAVEQLLTFLTGKQVVGRERAERLSHLARTASTGGADPFEDDAQDDDDDFEEEQPN